MPSGVQSALIMTVFSSIEPSGLNIYFPEMSRSIIGENLKSEFVLFVLLLHNFYNYAG